MNAHAPIILVIDPLSEPSAPRAVQYGIPMAFAASGAVLPQMVGLMRLQRLQAFADMEDVIRLMMEAETGRRQARNEEYGFNAASRSAHNSAAHLAQSEHYAKLRKARQDAVVSAITNGADDRRTIAKVLGLSRCQIEPVVQDLEDEGRIDSTMVKSAKTMKRVYWLVAQ